jgi:hypothetical protein
MGIALGLERMGKSGRRGREEPAAVAGFMGWHLTAEFAHWPGFGKEQFWEFSEPSKFDSLKGRADPASVRPFVRRMAVRMERA